MDVKGLYPFVLLIVLIGILLGVGLVTIDNFGKYARTNTNAYDDQFTARNDTCAQLANDYITTTSASFKNLSNSADITSCFNWDKTGKYNGDCVTLVTTSTLCNKLNGTSVNATYAFGATSSATTASVNVSSDLGGIGSNWLGLIITIAVLSIIIGLVVQSFTMRR